MGVLGVFLEELTLIFEKCQREYVQGGAPSADISPGWLFETPKTLKPPFSPGGLSSVTYNLLIFSHLRDQR